MPQDGVRQPGGEHCTHAKAGICKHARGGRITKARSDLKRDVAPQIKQPRAGRNKSAGSDPKRDAT